MTTITLPAEIEGPLAEEARRRGTTPELLALDTLRLRFAPPVASPSEKPPESNLLDFLAGYVGLVEGSTETLDLRKLHATDSYSEQDSVRHLGPRREAGAGNALP